MRSSSKNGFILASVTVLIAVSGYGQDWTRNFRIGLDVGLNLKADFKTSGNLTLEHGGPGQFDDGFVGVDDTGNAQGFTSNWGYQNAGQVSGNTLTFHKASAFDSGGVSTFRKDDTPYIGFEAAYGGTIKKWGFTRLGWEAGFGFMPVSMKDRRPLSGTLTFDTFEVSGITFPDAPYPGSFTSAGSPTVQANPTPGAPLTGPGTLNGTRELDLTMYTLRLGPTFYWHFARRWGLNASLGPAVSIATGDYKYDEQATLTGTSITGHVVGKFGKTDVLYGGYVNAIVLFRLENQGDLFAGVQFMPLTGTTFSKGGREAKLDASAGIHFMAGVSWPF